MVKSTQDSNQDIQLSIGVYSNKIEKFLDDLMITFSENLSEYANHFQEWLVGESPPYELWADWDALPIRAYWNRLNFSRISFRLKIRDQRSLRKKWRVILKIFGEIKLLERKWKSEIRY